MADKKKRKEKRAVVGFRPSFLYTGTNYCSLVSMGKHIGLVCQTYRLMRMVEPPHTETRLLHLLPSSWLCPALSYG